jgi:hypothetical protein
MLALTVGAPIHLCYTARITLEGIAPRNVFLDDILYLFCTIFIYLFLNWLGKGGNVSCTVGLQQGSTVGLVWTVCPVVLPTKHPPMPVVTGLREVDMRPRQFIRPLAEC